MKNLFLIEVGSKIRECRINQKLSQEELADLVGLHRTYIGSIERGEKSITIVTAQKIANGLKIKLSDLFKDF